MSWEEEEGTKQLSIPDYIDEGAEEPKKENIRSEFVDYKGRPIQTNADEINHKLYKRVH